MRKVLVYVACDDEGDFDEVLVREVKDINEVITEEFEPGITMDTLTFTDGSIESILYTEKYDHFFIEDTIIT